MLKMTSTLREKIQPDSDAVAIRKAGINEGMTQLRIAGAKKIAMGLTTVEEVLKVVPPDSEI
jgi:general secretion pathway protein E